MCLHEPSSCILKKQCRCWETPTDSSRRNCKYERKHSAIDGYTETFKYQAIELVSELDESAALQLEQIQCREIVAYNFKHVYIVHGLLR